MGAWGSGSPGLSGSGLCCASAAEPLPSPSGPPDGGDAGPKGQAWAEVLGLGSRSLACWEVSRFRAASLSVPSAPDLRDETAAKGLWLPRPERAFPSRGQGAARALGALAGKPRSQGTLLPALGVPAL